MKKTYTVGSVWMHVFVFSFVVTVMYILASFGGVRFNWGALLLGYAFGHGVYRMYEQIGRAHV